MMNPYLTIIILSIASIAAAIAAATGDDSDVLHPDYIERMSYIDSIQMANTLSTGIKNLCRDGRTIETSLLREQLSRSWWNGWTPALHLRHE